MTTEVTENTPHGRLTPKQITSIFLVIIASFIFTFFLSTSRADYSIRISITEGLQLTTEAKTAVTDYYTKYGIFPQNNTAAGLPPPLEIKNKVVESVTVSKEGIGDEATALITVTYNKKWFQNKTIVMSATAATVNERFGWDCTGGTLATKIRPSECRGDTSIAYDLNFPSKSIGIWVFVLCFFFVKGVSVFIYKKYSVLKFFYEVAVVSILFLIIDSIYRAYYVTPYINIGSFYKEDLMYGCFIGASILNLVFEPMFSYIAHRIPRKQKK